MALARLDVPGLMLYGGSIAPGRLRGKDVTIQDVFEAVGAHAAGDIDRRGAERRSRTTPARAPAPAAASSPPTRWRWRSRCSASRRWAARWCPPRTARRARSPRSAAGSCMELLERGPAPEPASSPRESLENAIAAVARRRAARPTPCCTCWRSRTRRACRSTLDDFDRIAWRTPLLARPQAGRPLRRHRPLPRRRRAARDPSGCWRRGCSHEDALTVTGQTIGEEADAAEETDGPGGRPAARPTRSSRTAASRSCAATSRPTAAW